MRSNNVGKCLIRSDFENVTPVSADELIELESLEDFNLQTVFKDMRDKLYANREAEVQKLLDAGFSMEDIVLEEFIGFPVFINKGNVNGKHVFQVQDKFFVRPRRDDE
jgi:hypothetical protein